MSGGECLFCRIAARQLQADIVEESDGLVAFRDVNPQAPTHLLVIPTTHIDRLADVSDDHATLLGKLLVFLTRLARKTGLDRDGYRVVINSGPRAGQTVFHLHAHLLGGRAMRWPPG